VLNPFITVIDEVRILIVEDERKLAGALQSGLEAEGYVTESAFTGEEGFYLASTQTFDLMIVDVMLPGRDGMEILRNLRQRRILTPALLLTARDAIDDRVRGLDSGADDYLVKPFAFAELLARIRALLRRGRPETPANLKVSDLVMDVASRTATRSGTVLDLTPREFDLLEYLLRNQGRVVSREMLARDIWKEPARHTPLDNVIDVHVARLRRKIDEPFEKKLVETVRGVGFLVRE
jgi:two-component system copper resistance phosphate regulon response regulator CusR